MTLIKNFDNADARELSPQTTLSADDMWRQVKMALAHEGMELPKTPRRPDVRLVVDNISGAAYHFINPGNHTGGKEELIPADAEADSVMVMMKGNTLEEQEANAKIVFDRYDLGNKGITKAFVDDLGSGALSPYVLEAYGPAPFKKESGRLAEVKWDEGDGKALSDIAPVVGASAAYGARPATEETVFIAQFPMAVKGTTTSAEVVESAGMGIAVSEDWQTKAVTTRPIAPSIAKKFYGAFLSRIPVAYGKPNGVLTGIDLKNGMAVKPDAPSAQSTP